MSESAFEGFASEGYESIGETLFEGEGTADASYGVEGTGEATYVDSAEDARSDRRRARARQIQAARQAQLAQQSQLRRPLAPPSGRAVQRPTLTAIRSVDLDTRAELDAMRRSLAKARRNGDMAMYSAVLSTLASQGIDTFGDKLENHDVVKALFRTAPLALLWPQKPRRGAEGILLHPAFIGAAGVAALVISGKVVNASHDVETITVDGPSEISIGGGPQKLSAIAADRRGNSVTVDLTWNPTDPKIATVTQAGLCTGVTAGQGTYIEAAGGGATGRMFVNIVA
jgi:hypothetical protein